MKSKNNIKDLPFNCCNYCDNLITRSGSGIFYTCLGKCFKEIGNYNYVMNSFRYKFLYERACPNYKYTIHNHFGLEYPQYARELEIMSSIRDNLNRDLKK